MGTAEPKLLIDKLVNQFGYTPFASRVAAGLTQTALRASQEICVIVTDLSKDRLRVYDLYQQPFFSPGKTAAELASRVNSAYNVAFEVDDLAEFTKRLEANKDIAHIIQSGVAADDDGFVRYVTVKSCVGDVCHTVMDKTNYSGPFLPSYILLDPNKTPQPPKRLLGIYNHVDHVAFGLEEGESVRVIDWYTKIFHFQRVKANYLESERDGYVIMTGNSGFVLRALGASDCSPNLFISMGEVAPNIDPSIRTNQRVFVEHHHGSGVHHVALNSSNIINTVTRLEEFGVSFAPDPPDVYYDDVGSILEGSTFHSCMPAIRKHAILVDVETAHDTKETVAVHSAPPEKFIMQKFCRPLNDKSGETVFFEIIERRHGAEGFGANNVLALWKALEIQMQRQ